MTSRKPNAKDWRNRAAADWTVTTFRAYLADEHERRYKIPYVARSYAVEGRWLKSMIADHGAEVVKRFIDSCFDEYKPTAQYPGLNFGFMYSYQRARVLPRVLAQEVRTKAATQADKWSDIADWL